MPICQAKALQNLFKKPAQIWIIYTKNVQFLRELFNKFHTAVCPLFCIWLCNCIHGYKCVKAYSNCLCILSLSPQQYTFHSD